MKFAAQHLQSAVALINLYKGGMPLQHFLKQYFAANKKFGSKDRRNIAHLCYSYYRLGHSLTNIPAAERIRIVLFISGADEWQTLFTATWHGAPGDVGVRLELVKQQYPFIENEIFPFGPLSNGINARAFILAHFQRPNLFIRTRTGHARAVQRKLEEENIAFAIVEENAIALAANTNLPVSIKLNQAYVVQDLSSQRVSTILKQAATKDMHVWDCCAASGGKSILAIDVLPVKQLIVSDVRASIIHNLQKRFSEAGIKNYTAIVVDSAHTADIQSKLGGQMFDLVICDAPCSGSGTWGRTPEQLYFFTSEKINYYSSLQRQIAANTVNKIKPGGYLLYITCSVFYQENEAVVDHLLQQFPLQLIEMKVLVGYTEKADTMFAALLQKK